MMIPNDIKLDKTGKYYFIDPKDGKRCFLSETHPFLKTLQTPAHDSSPPKNAPGGRFKVEDVTGTSISEEMLYTGPAPELSEVGTKLSSKFPSRPTASNVPRANPGKPEDKQGWIPKDRGENPLSGDRHGRVSETLSRVMGRFLSTVTPSPRTSLATLKHAGIP